MTSQTALTAIRFAFATMSTKAFYKWQARYITHLEKQCVHPNVIVQALDLIAELLNY